MNNSFSKDEIARLLLTPHALMSLSLDDAKTIVGYMLLTSFNPDTVIFEAQQARTKSDYLLLVLRGDVLIETPSTGDGTVVVDVLGSGHLIGEMGVLDGSPRSATCTAKTEVDVAMLSRTDLERLLVESPQIGARFLLAIATRLADRLRISNRKLLMMSQVNQALQEEISAPMVKKSRRLTHVP